MPRPHLLIHAQREPALPRPAATVLLLRDSPHGVQVLMTRRSLTASFAPGAYVFPGGGVDAADAHAHPQAHRRATQSDEHLTQAIAAIRESFEELGVLLARHADGRHASASDMAQLNRQAPAAGFAHQCTGLGLRLAAHEVFVLAHWTTDRDLPRRFEVPFLVARMPEGQTPVADETEQFEPQWVRPADALAEHQAGRFFIIFPTIRTLQRLQAFATVDAILAACAATEQPLWTSCPRAGFLNGEEARFMEHESPFGELAMVCPDGQLLHPLDWQHHQPVHLLKHVQRLTAANPGMMTGPGTNSYIVGTAATGFIVIDPGPYADVAAPADPALDPAVHASHHDLPHDQAHVQRLFEAAQGDIRAIICTHSHADHSPAAKPLRALCLAKNGHAPPILGVPSAATANAASQFTPDRVLQNNELTTLISRGQSSDLTPKLGETITLKAIYTPGHAANHVCLVLVEDGLLFSGDHILNGSTTIINPPDGAMTDYLDSLDALQAACAEHQIDFILPAHGYVLGFASQAIAQLKAHRLKREAKVQAAMQALPQGTLDDWVPLAYDDTPKQLWPIAKRSMLAHVERLNSLAVPAR